MSSNVRTAVRQALTKSGNSPAEAPRFLDGALARITDPRDRAFATRLFYCVLQNGSWIDWQLQRRCRMPIGSMQPSVRDTLRVCCAQLLFFDRIPPYSAVNEAVAECRRLAPGAAGLVNAVCRRIASEGAAEGPSGPEAEMLSVRYSHPLWFTERMLEVFGDAGECGKYLESNNGIPPITIRMNTLRESCGEMFGKAGLDGPDAAGAFRTPVMTDAAAEILGGGWGYVQDTASALAVTAAGPEPGMTVVDACAAPGGKSFTSCMLMRNEGVIRAFDISEKKIDAMREQAARLGCSCIRADTADSRRPLPLEEASADIVIADVPCSGFGVIRKKPEIRYKTKDDVAGLPEIGSAILDNVSSYVKPGGVLLFTTCTVLPEENEEVAGCFLSAHPEFSAESFRIGEETASGGMKTLYPHRDGTDGFFICKMRRTR